MTYTTDVFIPVGDLYANRLAGTMIGHAIGRLFGAHSEVIPVTAGDDLYASDVDAEHEPVFHLLGVDDIHRSATHSNRRAAQVVDTSLLTAEDLQAVMNTCNIIRLHLVHIDPAAAGTTEFQLLTYIVDQAAQALTPDPI